MTPMLDNFLAAFKGPETSPLYGKPLIYLLGAAGARALPGSVVEGPYGCNVIGTADKIAYGNFFNELYSEQTEAQKAALGPYLHDSDTAGEYGEGQIDPAGPGWLKNLTAQFMSAAAKGYQFFELDNPDAYGLGDVQKAITMAHSYGLGIIAKNPKLVANGAGALPILSHPNVFGAIVERGAGDPAYYDDMRRRARKDGKLPVWFVFDGRDGSDACAAAVKVGKFKGMGVSYSTGRETNGYNDSHTVLLPTV